jgi:ligand-binding SRPBCC domain-containing protein
MGHHESVSKVTLTTELPISAKAACELARKPAMFKYVVWPILRVTRMTFPDPIEVGAKGSARLWWLGILPAWTHHLAIKQLDSTQIYTNEHGGPVSTWNHRLTFTPIDEHRCRYTDEVETEDGWRGIPTRAFIRLMFRYRHRRWRTLTQVLA